MFAHISFTEINQKQSLCAVCRIRALQSAQTKRDIFRVRLGVEAQSLFSLSSSFQSWLPAVAALTEPVIRNHERNEDRMKDIL